MYVGKTTRTLVTRMSGYKTPSMTQSTNTKNNRRITEALKHGSAVEILALPDSGLMHYGKFHLNLAAGLEDDIIKTLNPVWNGGAPVTPAAGVPVVVSVSDKLTIEDGSINDISDAFSATFRFTLQPTYRRTGFFNVGVSSQKYLGADGAVIELFLGSAQKPVLGTINRSANANGTPRIMGGTALRDWFSVNGRELDSIAVQVISPTSIRLAKFDEI